ncbi:SDR family oxidoreductase [Ramlibacter albus]|uniref:SDR family oxidoreductase n=1 Tax=Ramlibacter albus TaxID=2079448 RepID=A0A923S2Z0_9BURK|nr:SDR family oxidoreductase [Ramlibacter albus]MBC5765979.1 SDR family oxidoreductase [Ramlibacter albus]
MRVLLTGASGFIGSAVAARLQSRGHEVVRVGRGPGADVREDFASVPPRDRWVGHLARIDAVVDTVGIIRETATQKFDALHTRAPIELFEACVMAGVDRVVHVSALGADESATSRYHLTKKAADDHLRKLPLRAAIVQPSLVYGPGGSSAALFNGLAVAPVLAMPHRGEMLVQPVHVDDVADGIVALVEQPPAATQTFEFAGTDALTMREYLEQLRTRLGLRSRLHMLPYPEPLFMLAATIAGRIPGSVLDRETAGMLLRGNHARDNALPRVLGREPRGVDEFLSGEQAAAARTQAVLFWFAPLLRCVVALVWIWTGIVSLGLYPVQQSYELLARTGLHGAAATAALYGAAALDLALGVLSLAAPARWRGWVWGTQLALIAGYTLLITLFLPEYWLHPYGPLTKNLPMMASIGLLWALEPGKPRKL